MKSLLISSLTILTWLAPNSPAEDLSLEQLSKYHRVTKVPFQMQDSTSLLCRPVTQAAQNPHEPISPQVAFCNVYVNEIAKATMESGKGKYPTGSLIIKSKLSAVNAKETELFTVMRKMPEGYDKEHGDWKYSVHDGLSFRMLASGRIDSCIDCHSSYSKTDYVTRTYMNEIRVGCLTDFEGQNPLVAFPESEFPVQDYLVVRGPNPTDLKQIILLFRKGTALPLDRKKPIEVTGKLGKIDLGGPAGTKSEYSSETIQVESWRYLQASELP